MSRWFRRHVRPLLSGALLTFFASMPAKAGEDVYRCRVLGDRAACERLPPSTDGTAVARSTPGSYARYLIHHGHSVDRALAEARSSGEEPTLQLLNRRPQRKPGSTEAHERYLRGGPALDDRRSRDLAGSASHDVR